MIDPRHLLALGYMLPLRQRPDILPDIYYSTTAFTLA